MDTANLIAQFNAYPRKSKLVFHCGLIRLPFWVEDGPEPFRPTIAISACPQNMSLNASDITGAEQNTFTSLLQAIAGTGKITMNPRIRPGKMILTDREIAQYLRQALRDSGVAIEVVDNDPIIRQFADGLSNIVPGAATGIPPQPPGILSGKGVTLERFHAFADAARRYYAAAPWRHLTSDDLIAIESPKPPPGLGFATVLGNGETAYGIGFFKNRKQFDGAIAAHDQFEFMSSQGKIWSLLYGPISDMPIDDADLFEEHGLPIAADNAYPFLIRTDVTGGKITRPTATELAFVEGLARALAETTEDEMDQGRWTKTVPTADGQFTYTLSLPALFEETPARVLQELFGRDHRDYPPDTAFKKADQMVDIARESTGRKQLMLARRAAALCPDCADAFILLAERALDPESECRLYRQAVEAGARHLGEAFFRDKSSPFWGALASRPYMRARLALANCLRRQRQLEEAASIYSESLRLNPNDNQGIRDLLATALYELGRFDELRQLDDRYCDGSAHWQYLRALLSFRTNGDDEASRSAVATAVSSNPHARPYLVGSEPLPAELPELYALGSEDEAILLAFNQAQLWDATPGAVQWLAEQKPPKNPRKSAKRKPK